MSTHFDPARESARQDNGQFGAQPLAEGGDIALVDASLYADFAPAAISAAVVEAKSTGKPVVIAHPSGNRIDLDESRTGSMAGDYSVGAEPSIRYTWATGNDEEPFISVTETSWVSARLDNSNDNLDYDDWEAAKESREMWETDQDNPVCDCSANGARKGTGKDPAHCAVHGEPKSVEMPREIRYAREDITEWIAHTDPNDIGGTELRSEYEHGEGSAITFNSRTATEDVARGRLKSLEPHMYVPENWK